MTFINEKYIYLNQNIHTKSQLFEFIADQAVENLICSKKDDLIISLYQREKEAPTIITDHIAMPHVRMASILKLSIFIITTKEDIIYHEQETASLFFCILAPQTSNNQFIDSLVKISMLASNDQLITLLTNKNNTNQNIFHHIQNIIKE
ncbi:MAG: PTS sugar transporter subunit IIA [Brevinema sp.]